MSKTSKTTDGKMMFWCPGCKDYHGVDNTWQISGTPDNPTFNPSVLVTNGHYAPGFVPGGDCWCTYNEKHPDQPSHYACSRCHSFVRDGMIEFLSDSSHRLAGQTVPLPELETVR